MPAGSLSLKGPKASSRQNKHLEQPSPCCETIRAEKDTFSMKRFVGTALPRLVRRRAEEALVTIPRRVYGAFARAGIPVKQQREAVTEVVDVVSHAFSD